METGFVNIIPEREVPMIVLSESATVSQSPNKIKVPALKLKSAPVSPYTAGLPSCDVSEISVTGKTAE